MQTIAELSDEQMAERLSIIKEKIADTKEKLDYYRKVFDKLPVAVFITDVATKQIKWMSQGISIFWGEIPIDTDIYNAVFKSVVHPEDYNKLISDVSKPFETKENRNFVFRVNIRNTKTVWYLSVSVPFKTNSSGKTVQTLSVALDINDIITKNEQLEQSAQDISKELNVLKIEHLTKSETEVLKRLGEGNSIKQTAEIQNRSYYTIENHKRNIFAKRPS